MSQIDLSLLTTVLTFLGPLLIGMGIMIAIYLCFNKKEHHRNLYIIDAILFALGFISVIFVIVVFKTF